MICYLRRVSTRHGRDRKIRNLPDILRRIHAASVRQDRRLKARAAWLQRVGEAIRPILAHFGIYPTRDIRYVVRPLRGHLGSYNHPTRELSVDAGHPSDTMMILATLVHELIHAALPLGEAHGDQFGRAARAVGLIGPLTATVAGPIFVELFRNLDLSRV
jgi:hypothetical protein